SHRSVHVLTSAREMTSTLPQSHILEYRAPGAGPGMGGCHPDGVKQIASLKARKAAECDRGVGHAESGEPDFRNRFVDLARDEGQGIEIGCLALISCHARGGVALDVLDRPEAFLRSQLQIAGRDIVLPVNERLLT